MAQGHLLILRINKNQLRLMTGHLVLMDLGKSRKDQKLGNRGF